MAATKSIPFPTSESIIAFVGHREDNLKLLSERTGANFVARGLELIVSGTPNQIERATKIVNLLSPLWQVNKPIGRVDIRSALQAIDTGREGELSDVYANSITSNRRGDTIRAKTLGQAKYIKSIRNNDMTFCIGPAGTGKTYLAAVLAVRALQAGDCEKIILTRPAVEAGEKLGFLPGDLQQKVNPFLRPLYDALYEFIDAEKIPILMEKGTIEVAPLAYMRGRTLTNAFIIVDEAQNTTPAQMKMVLTRLGYKSRMVIAGDVTQTDLPSQQASGLIVAEKILSNTPGISFCYLNSNDVVRHPLVERIVTAYEKYENR
jgi:phosphate starvation-inducible protein PhoH and related proteins